MKNWKLYFIAASLLFATMACEDDSTSETNLPAEMDKQFILSAADGNLFEVNAGQVASSKGTSKTIKDYGQRMLDEYTDINQELMVLAKNSNVDLPTTLSDDKQEKLDSLSGFSGVAFDTTYVNMMTVTHEEAVKLFEMQATTGRNNELKSFAAAQLPAIRQHLEVARAMRDTIQ